MASLDALKAEEATQKSKLEQKLAARRTKKLQELKLQEEIEIKKKEERDAQRLEVRWQASHFGFLWPHANAFWSLLGSFMLATQFCPRIAILDYVLL